MTLSHGSDTFTDIFLLVRVDDGWRTANKAYHRHCRDGGAGRRRGSTSAGDVDPRTLTAVTTRTTW